MKEKQVLEGVGRTDRRASVPEVVELVVFGEHAQLEQIRQTGPSPELATASQAPLELLAKGFDGATAQGSALFVSVFVVDVLLPG